MPCSLAVIISWLLWIYVFHTRRCSDHHLFTWHFAYGFAGCQCLNDLNVLDESPLHERFINSEFSALEIAASVQVVPYSFRVGNEEFNALYELVEGTYPRYAHFVRAMKQPITEMQKFFTKSPWPVN